MEKTFKKSRIQAKLLTTAIAIVAAVALPQIFHGVGIISGTGAMLGTTFLPMHFPVLIAGLIAGPWGGAVAGAVSPVLSYAISGMPAAGILPFMAIELSVYGLVCGLFQKVKTPSVVGLIAAMLAGRLVKTAAVAVAVYAMNVTSVTVLSVWTSVLTGLPGILLQLAVIPLLIYRLRGFNKYYD